MDKEFLNDPNLRDPRPSRPRKTAEDNPKPKNRISNGISDETYKKAMDNSINILKNGRKAERSQIESYRQELIAKDKELRQKQTEFDNQTQEMLRALQQDSGTNGASPKGKKRKRFSLFKK